jgi:ABC-type transporter Mla MlaB component
MRSAVEPSSVTLVLDGPVARARLPNVCRTLWMLLASSGATLALCDLRGVRADAAAVDALARLQLHARRHGCTLLLRSAPAELLALIELMGLRDVLLP